MRAEPRCGMVGFYVSDPCQRRASPPRFTDDKRRAIHTLPVMTDVKDGGGGGDLPPASSASRSEPTVHQLRLLLVVAEELHFGRAAARLFITQPALSRQVRVAGVSAHHF